ncbi:MAG: EAL domain-containing protein [Burkholderiales bacterium]|nr:EAL domain-containing protein [Burkholderiales bacterium]
MATQRSTTGSYLLPLTGTLTGWNEPLTRLARAFENDEFMLLGQSIVPLVPGRRMPYRLEILIRLREEEQHLVPPGAFLPVLEEHDMMPVLDRWVIAHAASWWREARADPDTHLNINLSAATLETKDFAAFVERELGEYAMPPRVLCFEVIGEEMASASIQARATATRLKALGCEFAVSAFGRDPESYEALKSVGAALVKIDSTMVRERPGGTGALTRMSSLQKVCARAGVATAAEFVECAETIERLRGIGIDYAQGYGVARPQPLAAPAKPEPAARVAA